MAISKITVNGTTNMDVTDTTAAASDVATGKYFYTAAGVRTAGTASGGNDFIVTVSWNSSTSDWEPDCTWAEASAAYAAGKTIVVDLYGDSGGGTADGEWSSGDDALTYWVHEYDEDGFIKEYGYTFGQNGLTGGYEGSYYIINNQSKSATPSETAQTVTFDAGDGYTGLGTVTVGAISSSYVGSGIDRRDSTDMGVSGATITAPAGYYSAQATKTVASGSATPAASISGTGASVSTGTNTLTLSKTVSNTPQVSAGYISAGTAGNSSVSLTASVTTQAAQTIYPSSSDQTIGSGRYLTGTQTIKGVTTANLTADNIKSGVTVTVGDSADADRVLSVTGTYTGGGGGTDHLTLLATKSLGTISTSSTSATDTGQTLAVTGFDAYDRLVAICYTPTHTNGRHVATIRFINFSATSNLATRSGTSIANSTQHFKLSSSGTMTQRSGTTPYGVYINAATISTSTPRTCTLTIYQRYNNTSTGTINGTYQLDVYGVKLKDLF